MVLEKRVLINDVNKVADISIPQQVVRSVPIASAFDWIEWIIWEILEILIMRLIFKILLFSWLKFFDKVTLPFGLLEFFLINELFYFYI